MLTLSPRAKAEVVVMLCDKNTISSIVGMEEASFSLYPLCRAVMLVVLGCARMDTLRSGISRMSVCMCVCMITFRFVVSKVS